MTMKNIIKKYDDIIHKVDCLVLSNDIIEKLQSMYYSENKSFLSEYPSVIIYLSYKLKYCKDKKEYNVFYNKIIYYLHKLIDTIKSNSTNNIALCYGFTGYVYALDFLTKQCNEFNKLLDKFETILLSLANARLIEIEQYNKVQEGYFDVIQGLSSVGKYLLDKENLNYNQELLLKHILNYLIEVIDQKPIIFPEFMPNEELKQKFPEGYINLGVAHGLLGPLNVLALGYEKFNNSEYLFSVERGLHYYKESLHTDEFGKTLGWNGRVSSNLENKNFIYNPSWCYGSIGIARVLYNISKIIDDRDLRESTIEVYESFGKNFNCEEFLNNAICHGRAGTMLLFNLMYLDTGKIQFKTFSDNLYEKIINSSSESEYVFLERDVYFRGRIYEEPLEYIDFGILNGISGIVLALMAQQLQDTSPLAEMFFM